MKKALIYNPYFDTLGGGEKYTVAVVMALEKSGYQTTIAWKDLGLNKKIGERFDLSINPRVDTEGYLQLKNHSLWDKFNYLKQFDLVFWVSDGSFPFLFGKRNILLIQVPFMNKRDSYMDKLKCLFISRTICYSEFVKRVIDTSYGLDSIVIYPPHSPMKVLEKEKIILSVGRFDGLLHNKRQDVLIDAFRHLNIPGWKLVLAGGDMGQTDNLAQLRELAKNIKVEFAVNPTHDQLETLYGHATLFWHAAGFGVDQLKNPEKTEHFGIATVEAMSAGAVPLVFDAGGQPEIVKDSDNGYLWSSIDELNDHTRHLIQDPALMTTMSHRAQESSTQFSMEKFIDGFTNSCIS